jgi:hypothetical protein
LARGVTAERHGRPYLDRNRLAGWHLLRERDIRRPLIADETIRALRAVALRVHPRFTLLIQSVVDAGRLFSQLARNRSLDEHRCPLRNGKLPASAQRNGNKTATPDL